ncbi:hypothetical protein J437_LFUL006762 [Ladona fulva]|uniref:K Homology domain-containing protein n=1 Tax=Ladona fulva TaxID=123851 RepID=A0A8K0K3W1_LADFU|nr:hypothetical protein J437_LFUL006762 [Ladona fulva]
MICVRSNMVDKINYLLPAAFGAAGLSLYAYFEYNTWLKQKRAKNAEDDKVNHRFMLNKAYASSVVGQVDLIASSTDTDIGIDKLTEDDVILSLNIRGRKENVKEAEAYINRIIEATPDMTTMSIVVPKERLMAMLGDYGDKIHGLSQETGCKINLKCDPVLMAGSPFYIEIEGPTDEVMFACDKVKEMLARDPTVSSPSELDSLPKIYE